MSPASAAAANLVSSATASKTVGFGSELSTFLVDSATSLVDGLSALSDMMSGFEAETREGGETVSNDQPLVRDTRSDLLAAIREGGTPFFLFASFIIMKILTSVIDTVFKQTN